MITAYAKLKEQMQKDQEGARKRGAALSPAADLCRSLDKAREKVEKADNTNWSDEDRLIVNDSISALQEALNIYINPPETGEGEAPASRKLV